MQSPTQSKDDLIWKPLEWTFCAWEPFQRGNAEKSLKRKNPGCGWNTGR